MSGGAVAVWDYDQWQASFPEFNAVPEGLADNAFNIATLYLRNDGTGPVSTTQAQTTLLYLLTSHIVALSVQAQGSGDPGSPQNPLNPVGRIASAGEGSVNISTEADLPQSASWFAQTRYGLMYWQATAVYRTMRYRPGPLQPGGLPGWRGWPGGGWNTGGQFGGWY